jgi:hypothetical protein
LTLASLPSSAAWRHVDAQDGFETAFFRAAASGYVVDGHTSAIEDGVAWAVHYTIEVDELWVTRHCRVQSWSEDGERELLLSHDAAGRWRIDGVLAPALDGCLDVDLEASACTNMLPIRRADLPVLESMDAPAVYVRTPDLAVERLEQTYFRLAHPDEITFAYRAPRFGLEDELVFGPDGLVRDYPGIAQRIE